MKNESHTTVDSLDIDDTYQKHLEESTGVKGRMTISSNFHVKPKFILMEGWLLKKSPNKLVGYQKRFVRLLNGKLYYYKDAEGKFKGCVDFHIISATFEAKDDTHFCLILHNADKKFYFKIMDGTTIEQWRIAIQQHIELTKKYTKLQDIKIKEIWRYDRISYEYFRREADTGDLLLFKGNSAMCKVQRAFTGDEYDHVALLLRYNNGELFLFESIGTAGVNLLSWTKFVQNGWHKLYNQLVFRHLDVERTELLIEQLEGFIKIAIGKKYNISPSKLMKRFSKSAEDMGDYERSNKTYFCSELIAAAYKKMQLLDQTRSAASYWPGEFAGGSKLQLLRGSLSNELHLDLQL